MACADEGSFYLDFLVPFSSKETCGACLNAFKINETNEKELELVPLKRDGKVCERGFYSH